MAIGLYGPEYLQFDDGGPAANVPILVFLPGTKTKVQIFSDRTGLHTGPNPVWTDHRGELVFFAQVGAYDLCYEAHGISITIPVEITGSDVINADTYVHVQNSATDIWQVVHNLGVKPTVIVEENTLLDISYPAIRHIDDNNLQLRWGYNTSGRATCRR